jgi:Icc-related predicted phosphoesterase
MRIIAISDVHEKWDSLELPAGDVLVIAGDLCERRDESFAAADEWLASVQASYSRVLYVPGNHDGRVMYDPRKYGTLAPNLFAAMLVDKAIFHNDLRLHAMPWDFADRDAPESLIPSGLDILVTHEPVFGILDFSPKSQADRLGNRTLLQRVNEMKPRLMIHGHCHMAYGIERNEHTTFVNVAICGGIKNYYAAAHPATIIDIDKDTIEITQWR